MKKFTIGIDVGGTNIKMGIIDNKSSKIIARGHLSTSAFVAKRDHLIKALILAINQLLSDFTISKKDVAGIGFGLPGLINPPKGMIDYLPNIPGWRNVPLKRIVERDLRIPVYLENDVNLITLGEWKFGAGKGYKNLVCITLGTGVGGGLIIDNHLYRGEGFVAGEIGHVPLNEQGPDCNCGGFGCFERYVGNRWLLDKAKKVFNNNNLDLPDVGRMAREGNVKAIKFWHDMGVHIGNAMVGIVNVLNPRLIIIGGGVSNNFRFIKGPVEATLKRRAMEVQSNMVKVVRAQLGNDAGILGAQVLVKEEQC